MSSRVDVRVAIVNWNTAAAALEAAAAYAGSLGVTTSVVIVDNASAPSERALLAEAELPAGVELSLQDTNLGYGKAANLGLSGTEARFVCVSNADLRPMPEMLKVLVEAAEREPAAGLLAPSFGERKRGYHSRLPAPLALPLWAFSGWLAHFTVPDPAPGVVLDVEQPAGACLLARTEVWRKLGGFDEQFFLWLEDVDLAKRSLDAGYRNLVVGSAVAVHIGAQSFDQLDGVARHRIWNTSLGHYTAKHHPRMLRVTRLATLVAIPSYRVARAVLHRFRARRATAKPV
ncbi:MAG: glycosyltransferase [Solirubrobacteraceae bacterium]